MKHSKITAIVLTLCMLVTLMVVAPTAASATTDATLVKDGSFEAWGITGERGVWEVLDPSTTKTEGEGEEAVTYTDAVQVSLNNTVAKTGNYSIKIAGNTQVGGRHAVYQNIGKLSAGVTYEISVMVKVDKIVGNPNARLIARAGTINSGNDAFAPKKAEAVTDGWVKFAVTGTNTAEQAAKDIFLTFEVYGDKTSDYEIYLDDFKVEEVKPVVVKPSVTNGDFETGDLTGWTISKNGVTPTVKEDTDGNHYVEFDMNAENTATQEGVYQKIRNLTPGKKYFLLFDAFTTGAFLHLDGAGHGFDKQYGELGLGSVFTSKSTGGKWERLSHTWTQPAGETTMMFRLMLWGSTGFEQGVDYVRLDNITLMEEDADANYINGDFEYKTLTGWTPTAQDGTIEIVTENGNSCLKISDPAGGSNQSWVIQTVSGLDSSKTYKLSVEVFSPASNVVRASGESEAKTDYKGSAHFDTVKTGTTTREIDIFSQLATYGEWEQYFVTFSGKTDFDVRLMCFNPDNNNSEAYVLFDNVVIEEEVNDDNLISNGSFEYGHNGLGMKDGKFGITRGAWGYWAFGEYGNSTVQTLSTDSVDGKYSRRVSQETAAQVSIRKQNISYEAGATYLYTVYVKNISLKNNSSGVAINFYVPGINPGKGDVLDFGVESLPVEEWTCLQWTNKPTSANFDVRVQGAGEVLIDNVSMRKLTSPVVSYTGANGVATDNLVDGGKVTVIMPAVAADQGNVYALALYNRNGNNKTLLNVNARTITEADVTAGYANFTLAADALGADFANVNYAKLIILKGGSYQALQEYDLLVKAAQ